MSESFAELFEESFANQSIKPGAILTGEPREFCRRWPNQVEVTVTGSHFIQEDSPEEIANALSSWIQTI